MFKRLPSALVLVVFLWGCGRSPAPESNGDDKPETFTFDSIACTSRGKLQTSQFKKGVAAQLPADTVQNEITVKGTYGPGNSSVTDVGVYFYDDKIISLTPTFKDGKWSATIEANKLETNTLYSIRAVVKGNTESVKVAISSN